MAWLIAMRLASIILASLIIAVAREAMDNMISDISPLCGGGDNVTMRPHWVDTSEVADNQRKMISKIRAQLDLRLEQLYNTITGSERRGRSVRPASGP